MTSWLFCTPSSLGKKVNSKRKEFASPESVSIPLKWTYHPYLLTFSVYFQLPDQQRCILAEILYSGLFQMKVKDDMLEYFLAGPLGVGLFVPNHLMHLPVETKRKTKLESIISPGVK